MIQFLLFLSNLSIYVNIMIALFNMKKNIGLFDRYLRLAIGVGLLLLALLAPLSVELRVIIALLGCFTVFEALVGWCGFYALIGKDTCPIQYEKK